MREMMSILYIESKHSIYESILYKREQRPSRGIPNHTKPYPGITMVLAQSTHNPPYIALKPPYIGGYTGFP